MERHRHLPADQAARTACAQCAGAGIACYDVVGGSVTWQVSTSPGAFCTYQTPSTTTSIAAGSGGLNVETSGSDTPGYGGGLTAGGFADGTIQCGSSDPGKRAPGAPGLLLFDQRLEHAAMGRLRPRTAAGSCRGRARARQRDRGLYSWNLTGQ